MRRALFVVLAASLAATGCASVAPWQREVQSLEAMRPSDPACQRFEINVEVYREGAAGANGGKSGGGCGCT